MSNGSIFIRVPPPLRHAEDSDGLSHCLSTFRQLVRAQSATKSSPRSTHPADVLVLILPLLRPLRLLRLVTLLAALNRYAGNSLRGRVSLYLVGSVSLIVFVASLAVLDAERGGEGAIQTFGDALWWSMTTITTVGYGDTFPVSTTGRAIAVALMLAGNAVLGVATASFASWLVERVADAGMKADAATRDDISELRHEIQMLRDALMETTNPHRR